MAARIRRMAADQRRTVRWLASAPAVILVTALAWLSTDEPPPASALPDNQTQSTPATEVPRVFSGVAALEAMIIEAPSGRDFVVLLPGSDGVGSRTLETLVAEADAAGGSGSGVRSGLEGLGYQGGVRKGWVDSTRRYEVLITVDEFGAEKAASAYADVTGENGVAVPGATPLQSSTPGVRAWRRDVQAASGVQHQLFYAFSRGRRAVLVQFVTSGELDVATAEADVRRQAERLEGTSA